MGFNLENYEQVKDRITRFYADHPDGRIVTELVNDPASLGTFAAFKASAYLGDILKATGYAMEQQGQGVNRDAWVENAETSAIGRALANMDYCGTLRPSREEMVKVSFPKTMPDNILQAWKTKITLAKDVAELKAIYLQAHADTESDPKARDEIVKAKDARKKELEK